MSNLSFNSDPARIVSRSFSAFHFLGFVLRPTVNTLYGTVTSVGSCGGIWLFAARNKSRAIVSSTSSTVGLLTTCSSISGRLARTQLCFLNTLQSAPRRKRLLTFLSNAPFFHGRPGSADRHVSPQVTPARGDAAWLTHGALPVSKIGSSASYSPYR